MTSFVDILPTIAEIVKDRPDKGDLPYDGSSLLDLLSGKVETMDRDIYLGVGAAVNNRYKLVLKGRNQGMGIQRDFFVDYETEALEKRNMIEECDKDEYKRMKDFIIQYDTIAPYWKEIPFGQGRKEFIPPKEWRVTEP